MNLNIGDEWEVYVRKKVDSGLYQSSSEVIREGLRLLREKDLLFEQRLKLLEAEIASGFEALDAGQAIEGEAVFQRIRERSRLTRKNP